MMHSKYIFKISLRLHFGIILSSYCFFINGFQNSIKAKNLFLNGSISLAIGATKEIGGNVPISSTKDNKLNSISLPTKGKRMKINDNILSNSLFLNESDEVRLDSVVMDENQDTISVEMMSDLFEDSMFSNHSSHCGGLGNELETCRYGRRCLPPHLYKYETCAQCYTFMPPKLFANKLQKSLQVFYWNETPFLISVLSNGTHKFIADGANSSSEVSSSFQNGFKLWLKCCSSAVSCCQKMLYTPLQNQSLLQKNLFCPRTWDGWQCWQDAKRGETSFEDCPHYIYFFTKPPNCIPSASKTCESNGHWYSSPTGVERSHYLSCSMVGFFHTRIKVQLAAHIASLAALIPAVFIFTYYRQLKVPRVKLHKNLFVSLLLNSCCVLLFQTVVMLREVDVGLIRTHSPLCVLLLSLTKFSRLTNYMWMFCEAFYLHKMVSSSFAEQKKLKIFYLIGWGFPLISIIIFASLRYTYDNDKCWLVHPDPYQWVVNAPCLLALVINTLLMVDIIRILVTKLRAANACEPRQYRPPDHAKNRSLGIARKAVRATLVLIPLFGLHFLVTIYRPESVSCRWTEMYHYLNSCIDGLQGFVVAVVFCYMNGEVRNVISRSYKGYMERRLLSRESQRRSSQAPSMHPHTTVSIFEFLRTTEDENEHLANKRKHFLSRSRRSASVEGSIRTEAQCHNAAAAQKNGRMKRNVGRNLFLRSMSADNSPEIHS